uniref:Uncharacterized protein n=1 Tax=Canis lupus familiaris TaxID=9615 RepID=A0A8C0SA45_CANLF
MLHDALGKTFQIVSCTIQYGCIPHCAFEYADDNVFWTINSAYNSKSGIVSAENLSGHCCGIQRGDFMIAKSQSDPKSNICKRVIGLQGDKMFTNSSSDFFKSHSYFLGGAAV